MAELLAKKRAFAVRRTRAQRSIDAAVDAAGKIDAIVGAAARPSSPPARAGDLTSSASLALATRHLVVALRSRRGRSEAVSASPLVGALSRRLGAIDAPAAAPLRDNPRINALANSQRAEVATVPLLVHALSRRLSVVVAPAATQQDDSRILAALARSRRDRSEAVLAAASARVMSRRLSAVVDKPADSARNLPQQQNGAGAVPLVLMGAQPEAASSSLATASAARNFVTALSSRYLLHSLIAGVGTGAAHARMRGTHDVAAAHADIPLADAAERCSSSSTIGDHPPVPASSTF